MMNKCLFVVFVFFLSSMCGLCLCYADDSLPATASSQPKEPTSQETSDCDLEFERIVGPVYVVNLDRSRDRLAYMTALLGKEHIKFERFSAVDGKTLRCINLGNGKNIDIKKIASYKPRINPIRCIAICDRHSPPMNKCHINSEKRFHTTGEVGCTMSHRCIWHDVVKHNYKGALVLEDDVVLIPGFKEHVVKLIKNLPEDTDILFVGFQICGCNMMYTPINYILSCISDTKSDLFIKLNPTWGLAGTYAYYITQKGAKRLVSIKSEHHIPIDVAMIVLYRSIIKDLCIYASKKKVVYVTFNFAPTIDHFCK